MIDLSSDTATRPTDAMRRAIAAAEVGDEQRHEDPSVNALCDRVARLLGQEAAIFLPSGIMCNQIAVSVHCRPGDEILAADKSHILQSEGGAVATTARALVTAIPSNRGVFSAKDLESVLRTPKLRAPNPRLVAVEQTSSRGGGAVWPLELIHEVCQAARQHGLKLHMDGARLMNAAVASGVSAATFAGDFDSCWLCLTKGLGCPVGAVLAGNQSFIDEAWKWKHRMGGAMRQSGILAAAGLYALDHHVERLAVDHANARLLADILSSFSGISISGPNVDTNIVLFEIGSDRAEKMTAPELACSLEKQGIRIRAESDSRFRAITHLDIDEAQIRQAARAIGETLSQ